MVFNVDPAYVVVAATLLCTYLGYLQGKGSVRNPNDVIEDTIDSLIEQGFLRVDEEGEILKWDDELERVGENKSK